MPSDEFVKRMQEGQTAILKKMYADLSQVVYGPSPMLQNLPPPKPPTLRQRISWRIWRFRSWLASLIAGRDIDES
jgi:hypothetical protein